MTEVYLRIGQAAAEIGITINQLRKLCESGRVEAERTDGGQWRLPVGEIERMKKEGVPPVPVGLAGKEDGGVRRDAKQTRPGATLLADPSSAAVGAAEDALISENEVKVTRNRVEKLKLRREAVDHIDALRARNRRIAEEEAAAQEQERQEQDARQREIQRQQAARERSEWRDRWISYAQRKRPSDAPEEINIDVVDEARRVLERLDPSHDYGVVRGQVDAAVARALAPWKASQAKRDAIESTLRWEAAFSDPERNRRAREAAAEAIEKLRTGASHTEIENAAKAAVQPLIREYEHAQKCELIVRDLWCYLRDENSVEREDAQDAVREALSALHVGASERQFEQARETALQPIRERIAARLDETMRQAALDSAESSLPWGISDRLKKESVRLLSEAVGGVPAGTPRAELDRACARIVESTKNAHERNQQKERLVDDGLGEIYRYIQRLEKDYEFDKGAYSLEQEIREPIRKALWEELTGKETAEQVAGIVRRLVRDELEIG